MKTDRKSEKQHVRRVRGLQIQLQLESMIV